MPKKTILAACVVLYILGATAAVRCSFFDRNWLERLKRKFPYSVTVIAHRGGSLLGPENTLHTFEKGLKEGHADMLELDVRQSKDGRIVVCHDQNLGRVCGEAYEGVRVSDITVGNRPDETLPQTSSAISLHFKTEEFSQYEAREGTPENSLTRLCLLDEVFERFPGVPLHVDIKDADYSFTKQVLDLIEKHHRESITFVGTSNSANVASFTRYFSACGKEKRSRFRLFANPREVVKTYVLFHLGLLPFARLDYDVFSVPAFTVTMRADAGVEFGKLAAKVGCFFFTSPVLWRYLERRGIAVLGWVANDEPDFAEATRWPLNGLMSDEPTRLYSYLQKGKGSMVEL